MMGQVSCLRGEIGVIMKHGLGISGPADFGWIQRPVLPGIGFLSAHADSEMP